MEFGEFGIRAGSMRQELQAAMDESSAAGPQTWQILDGGDQSYYQAAGIIRQQVHSSD